MKKTLLTILALILTVTLGVQVANALGTLNPSGTAGDATQYTLNDIYTKLTTNTGTSTKSGLFTTPGSVAATFRTLSEIYNAIPTIDATKVATGTSYLGVAGTKQDGVIYPTQWSSIATSSPGSVNWSTAMSYCDSLTEGSYTDWRLPTYIELVNTYLTTNPGNSLSFDIVGYWVSTEIPGDTTGAFRVVMDHGSANAFSKSFGSNLVRCTR